MKKLMIAGAFALCASAAYADEVVIEHRDPDVTTTEKSIHHDADGCTTKSVTKSNDEGDSVTKSKTEC